MALLTEASPAQANQGGHLFALQLSGPFSFAVQVELTPVLHSLNCRIEAY